MSSPQVPSRGTDSTPLIGGSSPLQAVYQGTSERIRGRFQQSKRGGEAIRERSDLVDTIITQLWESEINEVGGNGRLCAVALGGYGRQALFPCSDVDLLFLSEGALSEVVQKQAIPKFCRALWDLRLRVSPAVRTLAECNKLHRDNFEFNVSLLDCRLVCGSRELFELLHDRIVPRMVASEAAELRQRLVDLTQERHKKYGNTIFHLEPNIKECPGGLRDYQVACWLGLLSALEKTGLWPAPEELLPEALRSDCLAALNFLSDVRCFLHYRQGRDLNVLSYELQAEAALSGIGLRESVASPAEWMRAYFRCVRTIYRLETLFEEERPSRSGLSRLFEARNSRLSNADFSVVEDRVFLRQLSSVKDPSVLLGLFEFVARHGLKLSTETERCVEGVLPVISEWAAQTKDLWPLFRSILVLPHAAAALRAMHRLGVLVVLFPEFHVIDALVVRDYYHRYTVDEHSFVAIENVHALRSAGDGLERQFRDVFEGIERPELLFLALLLHDVGKGAAGNHVEASVAALGAILQRLRLEAADAGTVTFLVANHLRMSATVMRRDIFDSRVVREFSESVKAAEPLKMLTLLTYADIKSVNPEALTPWKAELLWQLYAAASNDLNRTVDDQRVSAEQAAGGPIAELIAAAEGTVAPRRLKTFLEGFPKRYLTTHPVEEIVAHCRMYGELSDQDPQIAIVQRNGYYDLVLLTIDSPFLFAGVAGTLSSWGMNILKADAYSNKAGIVLDTFRISDRFHTLELNPAEVERLKSDLAAAVSGEVDVAERMREKFKPADKVPKVKIEPRLYMDNLSSAHSTLLEVTAQDRPGLLYDIGTCLSEFGCNIEAGIVDTQGQTAIDVFYLTCAGNKLDAAHQQQLRAELLPLL